MNFLKYLIAVACAAVLLGCQGGSFNSSSQAESVKEARVLAEVNGVSITIDDFRREVSAIPEHLRPLAATPKGRRDLLEKLVLRELILQQAEKEGMPRSRDAERSSREADNRQTVETFLKKKIEADAVITDAEVKSFYNRNREKFSVGGEQVRASHILLKSEREAGEVLSRLRKGASFRELAKLSACTDSASKGGDLGWFGRGVMVQSFEDAAFRLKEGEVSEVVRTPFGYHIIMVTGKRAAPSFEEVREQIRADLISSKQREAYLKLREGLTKTAKVMIREYALNSHNW